jgi:hypothetical protein
MKEINYITNRLLDHGCGSKIHKLIPLIGLVSYLNKLGLNYEFVYSPLAYDIPYGFEGNQLCHFYHKPITNIIEQYIEVCNRWDTMINYNGKIITDINPNPWNFELGRYNYQLSATYWGGGWFGVHQREENGETIKSTVSFLTWPSEFPYKDINDEKIKLMTDVEFDSFIYEETVNIKEKIKQDFNIKTTTKDYTDIKIHIRRHDVHDFQNNNRFNSNEYYLNVISKLKEKYKSNYKITIHTQRQNFNPTGFEEFDIKYDDETLDNEVWVDLVDSDVLVTSKSSYSVSAGFLCDGIVIYDEDDMGMSMRCKNLNNWFKIDEI